MLIYQNAEGVHGQGKVGNLCCRQTFSLNFEVAKLSRPS